MNIFQTPDEKVPDWIFRPTPEQQLLETDVAKERIRNPEIAQNQKSIVDPKTEHTIIAEHYANVGKQLLDFTVNEFGPDVAKEFMANVGGNIEFLGRTFENNAIQKVGQSSEDYWRAKQTQSWQEMNAAKKAAAGVTMDPFNALTGGLGKAVKPAVGFVKAGTKLLGPKAMAALQAFKVITGAEDAEDILQNLTDE